METNDGTHEPEIRSWWQRILAALLPRREKPRPAARRSPDPSSLPGDHE